MKIAFFDFDGTITTKDSMLQFIRFAKGNLAFYFGLFLLSPVLVAFKIGILSNWRTKELLISFFFKGMEEEAALKLGQDFATHVIPSILRPEAIRELEFHKSSGTKIVIVTASFSLWIKPWCDQNQFDLIATDYDIQQGRLTGFVKGKNCYGSEKVRRIKERYDLKMFDKIYAYGDSQADYEMLNLADVKYLKWKIFAPETF